MTFKTHPSAIAAVERQTAESLRRAFSPGLADLQADAFAVFNKRDERARKRLLATSGANADDLQRDGDR